MQSIEVVADKLAQKQTLKKSAIATAEFCEVPREMDPATMAHLVQKFPKGFVLKWARLGYDGYGVLVCKSPTTMPQQIKEFMDQAAR